MDEEQLIFLVGAPRSGTTLLQRMLGSHPAIYTHPEPHLLTPLNYLGYYDTVDKAPYDHINGAQALREFCQELPRGEADYLDALRAYASTLYARVLAPSGKTHFLDKTPAYALILPFITKLYPRAKYIVLTRHPFAIMHSVAHSFFSGDYAAAQEANPIVSRYVPAMGEFLLRRAVPYVHVRYEDLVQDPAAQLQRITSHLNVPFDEAMVNYGEQKHIRKSYGDPVTVERHTRPVGDSLNTWAQDLQARPEAMGLAADSVASLDPAHLEAWGYPKDRLFDSMTHTTANATARGRLTSYQLKRRVLLALRKNIHQSALGMAVKKVRYACDVLLRT